MECSRTQHREKTKGSENDMVVGLGFAVLQSEKGTRLCNRWMLRRKPHRPYYRIVESFSTAHNASYGTTRCDCLWRIRVESNQAVRYEVHNLGVRKENIFDLAKELPMSSVHSSTSNICPIASSRSASFSGASGSSWK